MGTVADMRCRICGANARESGGYLTRVNPKGEKGIWECAPECGVSVSSADALLMALDEED